MAISVPNGDLPLAVSERSTAREEYRPDIDGLRAIAALAVLGVHAEVLPGGFVGVDIFFVISGYLISALILRALARGSFSSFEFYARRVKRIFPALIAVFVAVFALGWLTFLSVEFRQLGREVMEGAVFVYNLAEYWPDPDGHTELYIPIDLNHLWSLGVEEQFYLLWPLFLVFICKLKKRQLALIAAVTTISFIINVVMVSRGMDAYSPPWTRLWQLSLGGALAYMQARRAADLERLRSVFSTRPFSWLGLHNDHSRGLIGAALLVASCMVLDITAFPGWKALAPTIGALLVIAAGMKGWVNRYVLSTAPLVAVGLISYPVYLWHFVFLQIPRLISPHVTPMMTIAAVVGTFILSFLTYKYIELPLRYSPKTTVVAGALCVVMLVCGILGYVMFLGGVPARPVPLEAKTFVRASMEDWLPGTHDTSWTRAPEKFITLGASSHDVLYIGDSNMQQYYPRIEKVLANHPLNSHGAVFATRDWCAPVESGSAECRAFVHSAFEYAKGSKLDTVVISACWRCYFLGFEGPLGRSGKLKTSTDEALSTLQREIESLVLAGKRVYLVLGIPVGADLDPRSMIQRTIMPPGFRVVISSPKRSEVAPAIEPVRSRLVKIAQATGASVIDPMQSLCDEATCSAVSPKGEPVYHDWFNLSPSYVRENVRFLDGTVLDPESVSVAQMPSPTAKAVNGGGPGQQASLLQGAPRDALRRVQRHQRPPPWTSFKEAGLYF